MSFNSFWVALLTYFISSVLICVSDTVGNMALILATDCSVSVVIQVSVVRAGEAYGFIGGPTALPAIGLGRTFVRS
jgi:hypothetical protein